MDVRSLVGPGFDVDPTRSTAAIGSFYTDPAVLAVENERVFAREWSYVAHRSQLAETGDHLVVEVAGHSVVVVRNGDQVRAFHNVCQHRGHELVATDGHTPNVLVCPYHAWSYGLDGSLRGAPRMREVPDFDRTCVSLRPVRLDEVGGFLFVNLDDGARPLREVAPGFEPRLASMMGESAQLRLATESRFEIAANWKVVTENFLEAYHVEFSGPAHRALSAIIDPDTYAFELDGRVIEYTAAGGAPETLPYPVHDVEAFTSTRGRPFHQIFLYPNVTISVFPGTNMVFVFEMAPSGPETTAERIQYFTLDGTLPSPSAAAEAFISRQLNHEDIALVEGVQRGLRSPGYVPGRFMVDAERAAGWGEQFVHHFVLTHLRALGVLQG